ncbi:MAG: ADP-ribosyl-[dinitrogen reductase] hydrolase [Gammaproteobacteria bacterium]|jgi:ADP-ribosyl-[dinitrogen reductase] hydrolase
MDKPEPKKSLIRISKSFETTCYIWFAAPYSQSEEVTLPAGIEMKLFEHEDGEEPYRFEASPVESEKWSPFLISSHHRHDKNYRHSYNFYFKQEEVELYCEALEQTSEAITPELYHFEALQGCLFGTAVGDAIGLPFEGISARRIKKLNPFPLQHRFLFGKGMLSDDTEHTCIVAHALIHGANDTKEFISNLSWSLRFWFLGLPAGIGMATLKACLKLLLFIPADKSGVFSAGNGPAMRSALLGVFYYDDKPLREERVLINTRITHTDPKAVKGAMIVAEMAARNTQGKPLTSDNCREGLEAIIADDETLKQLVDDAINSANQNETAQEFCQQHNQAKGVSGYIYHTLPVVIQIVLRQNNNYEQAITEAIACGGDTDTVAAIIGGIVGANVGKAGIPEDWLENLKDWPRDKKYLHLLCEDLAAVKWTKNHGTTQWMDPVRLLIRNAFFMVWVLAHGFRRLLPPY